MLGWLARLVPEMSATEREALDAGDVWVEGALFSGAPDLPELLREPYPSLSAREQAFLDGPVEEVCAAVDDWRLYATRRIPDELWAQLARHGFFGLTIPERYGGRGFSALGLSAILGKLASRSLPVSAVVIIPNSVGPAELILHYGSDEQKDHYLPRLARGAEIPCFALTEPEAGSDAASLRSRGVVFRGEDGAPWLRLDWDKRYITLAPVATLIALAVRLEDPDDLLGRGREPGITVVLVPTDRPGVEIGRHHDPMGIPFPNGPTSGRAVEVPASQIVGGPELAGRGWRLLMEALSAGRGITLPAQSAGGARMIARVVGAYAAVRRQFGQPIGRFEGVSEPLARIGGISYLMDAARVFTCGAVDSGHRPAVVSAMMKYQTTELVRRLVVDGMDVLGGAGLCRGPRNLLASGYAGAPISITVEGANILTRTLIVFGQGAVRCHPYVRRELDAVARRDAAGLARALAGHALRAAIHLVRLAVLEATRGRLVRVDVAPTLRPLARRLAWASARFAAVSELCLVALGPRLKRRGALTGRLADALSWMYLALATLRRFEAEGRRSDDEPFARWAVAHCLSEVQRALEGVLANVDVPLLGWWCRGPWALAWRAHRLAAPPSDALGAVLAAALQTPGEARDRRVEGTFVPAAAHEAGARLEHALRLARDAAPVVATLRRAAADGRLPPGRPEDLAEAALERGLLGEDEVRRVREAAAARLEVIQVDSFDLEDCLEPVEATARALSPA